MSFPNVTSVDALAFGRTPIQGAVQQTRAPAATDVIGPFGTYPIGQRWIDQTGNAEYVLTSLSTSNGVTTATWVATGGGSVELSTLTGDTGTAVPSAGNIKLAGTTNEITTAASGSTVTFTIPSTFIAPGSIASTTTLTGGTGITATTGNIVASTGNITTTVGSITSATTLTATLGAITATNGNFVATAAGTGIVTTPVVGTTGAGPITANGRVVSATFNSISIAAGATQALVIANTSITSNSQIGLVSWSGATTGAALTLQSVANDGTGHTSTFTFTNGAGATTTTANIVITYVLLN